MTDPTPAPRMHGNGEETDGGPTPGAVGPYRDTSSPEPGTAGNGARTEPPVAAGHLAYGPHTEADGAGGDSGELGEPGDPGDADGAPADGRSQLEQRSAVLLIAGFATVVLAALLAFVPVPYAIFSPGPVINTLGKVGGKPLITVSGRTTYPTNGTLDMTTVRVNGGPGNPVSLVSVLTAWLKDSQAAVPAESVFPPGQTQQESEAEDRALMVSSQESATAAALGALGIPVPTSLAVFGVQPGSPASKVLKSGDVLLEVEGSKITDLTRLRTQLQAVDPGGEVQLRIRRGKVERELVTGTLRGDDGRTLLGVFLDPTFSFPFTVKIEIENVVGPSAGMMFALGIIDTLTPGDLTAGKKIAGTGTIDADGSVGPIGGIQQKLVGARQAGAEYFLAPAGNCGEVAGHEPDGLQVVKVATLSEARTAVQAIAAGKATSLPRCT